MCSRNVDSWGQIQEDLVDFVECDKGMSCQAIAMKIITNLRKYGLDLDKKKGQGYDGAGNMSGQTKGAEDHFSELYPLALYLPCAPNRLNLVVLKSTQVTSRYFFTGYNDYRLRYIHVLF